MRRFTSVAVLPVLMAGAGLVAGCGRESEPGVYDIAQQEALARLRGADLGGFIATRDCGLPLQFALEPQGAGALRWIVRSDGTDLASFSVRLESLGPDQTRAVVDFPFNPSLDQTLTTPSGQAALRQPLQGAVVELVDAALTERGFDAERIGDGRSREDACAAVPHVANRAHRRANPWAADGAIGNFGEPTTDLGTPHLEAQPQHERGHEDGPEDLPPPEA